jgi:hypothetical protein
VVYGTQLKNITGKVKMVAVGYGREAEDGRQTLGGRYANELAGNMLSLSQDLNSANHGFVIVITHDSILSNYFR